MEEETEVLKERKKAVERIKKRIDRLDASHNYGVYYLTKQITDNSKINRNDIAELVTYFYKNKM